MTFHVGQKVVCVNGSLILPARGHKDTKLPNEGAVYTIRWVGEFPFEPDRAYGIAVRLEELHRGKCRTGNPAWDDYPLIATRFRPVIESKTNISVFTEMLTPKQLERIDR